ncbi:MAG TPA: aroma-sacti cluster domain-containing protein [Jatrophihabitans sp.]|jgi:hypothetical protein|nr:aroma-sacti cluster domain-containing protein [Jatrophihabitans sp.]
MTSPQNDQLTALAAAGFPIDSITQEQRAVYSSLSEDEVTLLIDLRARLDAVEPEVQAHTDIAGSGMF